MENLNEDNMAILKKNFLKLHIEKININKEGNNLASKADKLIEYSKDMGMPVDEEKLRSIEIEMNMLRLKIGVVGAFLAKAEVMLGIDKDRSFVFN